MKWSSREFSAMSSSNKTLSKNILWNAFGNLFYLGVLWLFTVLVTRKMGFEQGGVFSLALSVSAVFQALALFGTRNYQVSDLKAEFSDQSYLEARIITCAASFIVCIGFVRFIIITMSCRIICCRNKREFLFF